MMGRREKEARRLEMAKTIPTATEPTTEPAAVMVQPTAIFAVMPEAVGTPWRARLAVLVRFLRELAADRVALGEMEKVDVDVPPADAAEADGRAAGLPARPGKDLAAKQVRRYDVDAGRGVLVLYARGPLDIADIRVELRYSQLKHVSGQLLQQEAVMEELALRKRGMGSGTTM